MPRPEKPVESAHADLAKLALGLRELRAEAGSTYRDLSRRAGYAISVLSQAASGERLPTWDVVQAYVEACDGDPDEWRQVWIDAAEEAQKPKALSPQPDAEPRRGKGGSYAHAGALINLQPALAAQQQDPGIAQVQSPNVVPVTSPIRIFLVDDHEIVRRGVADLFEDEPDLTVVGDAADVTSARHDPQPHHRCCCSGRPNARRQRNRVVSGPSLSVSEAALPDPHVLLG